MATERTVIVRCPDDRECALERIAELGMPTEGSDKEFELHALIDAVERWDARHEDDDWA